MTIRDYLTLSPIVPVLTIERLEDAVPLARALVAGGLKVLEVTLRSSVALDAIRLIAAEAPDAILAAGTVLSSKDLDRAADAGARFAFSPGLAHFMSDDGPIPIVPGIATASELMKGLDAGHRTFKFFPAAPAGGADALRAFAGPFADVRFCPTGGIDATSAQTFLALGNVLCVGGSWLAPTSLVRAGDWAGISALARAASLLGQGR